MTDITAELTSAEPAVVAIRDMGAALTDPFVITGGEDQPIAGAFIVPDGYRVDEVDFEALRAPYRDRPARKSGTVQVRTVGALLEYHRKHATDNAEIWIDGKHVVDVLNANGPDDPEWGDHRAVLNLRYSTEWKRWTEASGNLMSHEDFAEFLEGAAVDVVKPDMATMLEIASTLRATQSADWDSSVHTQSGTKSFGYKHTINAKAGQNGQLEIPEKIHLALRIFEGGSHQPVVARFRYRLTGGGLRLGIVIDRQDEILEQALVVVAGDIEAGIDRGIVLAGSPA